MLLAIRSGPTAAFLLNPALHTPLGPQSILIAVGTPTQLDALRRRCTAVGAGATRGHRPPVLRDRGSAHGP
jgi:hypothetical protein